ncbi:MAG: polyphosphate kinase 2 family protein [Bacteroidetes bacterium]|nr:MAG: polyphosphate kinase 2 family protein [Bacteroidota bacterium]RLD80584.1 MAG: polyphosphate kinase 2 family protein [Bacteroidota bacterium]
MVEIDKLCAGAGKKISLKDYDPKYTGEYKEKDAKKKLKKNIDKLDDLQYTFYASDSHSLLIVLQAMDAAGKDGAIRHVMSGINPQGCAIHNFRSPSKIELDHDFLWRHYLKLPERGQIGIFNRSHYENVLVTKVHPEYILGEQLPSVKSLNDINDQFWMDRYEQINNFEKTIHQNGTVIIKFFLHLSKEEQKNRFLDRINEPDKNWKFSYGDIEEREHWDEYQNAFEQAISNTSTKYAPWYVIPADNKWFSRIAISDIIIDTLKSLDLKIPELEAKEKAKLEKAKNILLNE